jgi:hypothetical protein
VRKRSAGIVRQERERARASVCERAREVYLDSEEGGGGGRERERGVEKRERERSTGIVREGSK